MNHHDAQPTRSAAMARRTLAATAALAISLALSGLVGPAMAQSAPKATAYSKDGVSFQHPANWKVTEDSVAQDETRLRSIELEGPDDAVVTLSISPFLKGHKIEAFAATIARGREESAKSADAISRQLRFGPVATTPIQRTVAGRENQEGVSQRFVISLLGEKLPHEARFFKAELGGTTAIIMTQVAEEYAKATEPGFALVLGSLRYGGGR